MGQPPPHTPAGALAVEVLEHRRTALVALHGELDLVTISKVAEVVDELDPRDGGLRHMVLDLRGLSFMDVSGLRELLKQNEFARANHHNLAIVRGSPATERLLALTGVGDQLVLVDDPQDLAPPPYDPGR
jgi:anti-anti-sigma factor